MGGDPIKAGLVDSFNRPDWGVRDRRDDPESGKIGTDRIVGQTLAGKVRKTFGWVGRADHVKVDIERDAPLHFLGGILYGDGSR
jgi:hypothetical protein